MKMLSKIFYIIFVIYIIFELLSWPGAKSFQVIALLLLVTIYIIELFSLAIKRKTYEKIVLRNHFIYNLIGLITAIFILFKIMFWRSWIQIQYPLFFSIILVSILLLTNKFGLRRNFQEFVFKNSIIKIITLVLLIIVTITPYSSLIYWDDIRRNNNLEINQENLILKCHGYARYIWALRREGLLKEADEYEKEKQKECRQIINK